MKYNEKSLTDLFKKEHTLWDPEDLDWFDSQLVYKLQNNQLPEYEKNTLIEMMANDQSVMNRYLQLKQNTAPVKESFFEKFIPRLNAVTNLRLLATGLALFISLGMIYQQTNKDASFELDLVRGIPETSIYPIEKSLIKKAPEFFLVSNKNSQPLRLQLNRGDSIEWVSQFQQSNKFYVPAHIQTKLRPGDYSWSLIDKNDKVITNYSFTLH